MLLHQSRNELWKPCAVATRPGVSLIALTRRNNAVSTMHDNTT